MTQITVVHELSDDAKDFIDNIVGLIVGLRGPTPTEEPRTGRVLPLDGPPLAGRPAGMDGACAGPDLVQGQSLEQMMQPQPQATPTQVTVETTGTSPITGAPSAVIGSQPTAIKFDREAILTRYNNLVAAGMPPYKNIAKVGNAALLKKVEKFEANPQVPAPIVAPVATEVLPLTNQIVETPVDPTQVTAPNSITTPVTTQVQNVTQTPEQQDITLTQTTSVPVDVQPEITAEQLRTAVMNYCKLHGNQMGVNLMNQYGNTQVLTEFPKDKYRDLYNAVIGG